MESSKSDLVGISGIVLTSKFGEPLPFVSNSSEIARASLTQPPKGHVG